MGINNRLRFNLRTLLCVMLLLGCVTGYWASEHRKSEAEQALIARLMKDNTSRSQIKYQAPDQPLNIPWVAD